MFEPVLYMILYYCTAGTSGAALNPFCEHLWDLGSSHLGAKIQKYIERSLR